MKQLILFFLIHLFLSINSYGQSDTIILKIHPVVGDTLDAKENLKYKILNVESESFLYAVFVLIGGDAKVLVTYDDKSEQIDYSSEKVLQATIHVDNMLFSASDLKIENNDNGKSAKLKIVYKTRDKRIRKHSRIRFQLHDTDAMEITGKKTEAGLILGKLKKVNDNEEPSIIVKLQQKGRPRINIPLSNIKMIRFNTPTENVLLKILSVEYLIISFFTTKASFSEPDPVVMSIAAVTGYTGISSLIKGNKRYDIGINSKFEIFY